MKQLLTWIMWKPDFELLLPGTQRPPITFVALSLPNHQLTWIGHCNDTSESYFLANNGCLRHDLSSDISTGEVKKLAQQKTCLEIVCVCVSLLIVHDYHSSTKKLCNFSSIGSIENFRSGQPILLFIRTGYCNIKIFLITVHCVWYFF